MRLRPLAQKARFVLDPTKMPQAVPTAATGWRGDAKTIDACCGCVLAPLRLGRICLGYRCGGPSRRRFSSRCGGAACPDAGRRDRGQPAGSLLSAPARGCPCPLRSRLAPYVPAPAGVREISRMAQASGASPSFARSRCRRKAKHTMVAGCPGCRGGHGCAGRLAPSTSGGCRVEGLGADWSDLDMDRASWRTQRDDFVAWCSARFSADSMLLPRSGPAGEGLVDRARHSLRSPLGHPPPFAAV